MTQKNQAIQTALNGDWTQAIDLNKDLVKQDPSDIDALNRLALAYSITGKLKEAKSSYQKVVKLDPLNAIALKNLKRLKDVKTLAVSGNYKINNKFLEEPGKTKVVELVNIAPFKVIENLRTGQALELTVKRLKIFVEDHSTYLGVLPDDLANRLIKFIKAGGEYEAYLKSTSGHKVSVFIKEVKKSTRFRNVPSFISGSETTFVIPKRAKNLNSENTQEEESTYLEE